MAHFNTPLRYPGGKQKLTPFILELLQANGCVGGHYVEPYAGGAGVAIELLLGRSVSHVHLNDSSVPIYAFWKSVTQASEEFCRLISRASLSVSEWRRQREIVRDPMGHEELEVGFATLYLNRCNRSGVLSGGLIGGLSQTGRWLMDARFPRNELIRRVEVIAARADFISVTNLDAEKFIIDQIPKLPRQTFTYCDPPYFKKSSRLYLDSYHQDDHARIAGIIQSRLKRKWIVSYDAATQIRGFYHQRRQFVYDLQYHASTAYKGKEIFIFADNVRVPHSSTVSFINRALQKTSWAA